MTTRFPERLESVPDIPKEFGDDGGHFYRYYDELADEVDEDLVNCLKAQLDGILIFAGLFAGVNSAFLALTLPQMSADPADDTNALLLQIAVGGSTNITSAADLPSASFTPPPGIYPINVLFSVSLMFALLSSFMAVLGQQWIVHYRKKGGGGPEHQRWEQLRRYLGAKRWRLELVLDDLVPGLLQLGLVIFCIAFALYLGTLSQSLKCIVASLLFVAAAAIFAMSTCVAFDPWCPFKLPWSRIVRPVTCAIVAVVTWLGVCSAATVVIIANGIIAVTRRMVLSFHPPNPSAAQRWERIWRSEVDKFAEACTAGPAKAYTKLLSAAVRSAESLDDLKIIALKRVMCTSEDRSALIYSAINLQVIRDQEALSSLAKDVEFCSRLCGLYQAALDGRTGSRDPVIEARVFSSSFSHLLLIVGSVPFISSSAYGMNPLHIIEMDSLGVSANQIYDLNRGNSKPSTPSCDQCSHCVCLIFCMRVIHLLVEGFNDSVPTNFDDAYKDVVKNWTKREDLRLGCVVASVILCSKEWCDVGSLGFGDWPRFTLVQKLLNAYRMKSELEMFQTISTALATASAEWVEKPDHEIYVQLFELCFLPGRKEVSAHDYRTVLERVDFHLISIERGIRNKDVSQIDPQRGRASQNRCIQSVAKFLGAHGEFSRNMWNVVGASLERYLQSVEKLMKANPGHSQNATTIDVLRRIQSDFPEPQTIEASANSTGRESEQEVEPTDYARFHDYLTRLIVKC